METEDAKQLSKRIAKAEDRITRLEDLTGFKVDAPGGIVEKKPTDGDRGEVESIVPAPWLLPHERSSDTAPKPWTNRHDADGKMGYPEQLGPPLSDTEKLAELRDTLTRAREELEPGARRATEGMFDGFVHAIRMMRERIQEAIADEKRDAADRERIVGLLAERDRQIYAASDVHQKLIRECWSALAPAMPGELAVRLDLPEAIRQTIQRARSEGRSSADPTIRAMHEEGVEAVRATAAERNAALMERDAERRRADAFAKQAEEIHDALPAGFNRGLPSLVEHVRRVAEYVENFRNGASICAWCKTLFSELDALKAHAQMCEKNPLAAKIRTLIGDLNHARSELAKAGASMKAADVEIEKMNERLARTESTAEDLAGKLEDATEELRKTAAANALNQADAESKAAWNERQAEIIRELDAGIVERNAEIDRMKTELALFRVEVANRDEKIARLETGDAVTREVREQRDRLTRELNELRVKHREERDDFEAAREVLRAQRGTADKERAAARATLATTEAKLKSALYRLDELRDAKKLADLFGARIDRAVGILAAYSGAGSADEIRRILEGRDLEPADPALVEMEKKVLAFGRAMLRKLKANRHKGDRPSWMRMTGAELFKRLQEEVEELSDETNSDDSTPETIENEAADVGNIAMMIADRNGGLS